MSRAVKEELRRILPKHTDIYIMYGATEASARLSYLAPESYEEKMDSIGKPIPGVVLKFIDAKGEEVQNGKKGELVASGPNIMQGYWKAPEETALVLDKQWYRTGDYGYKDEDGFFYIEGRKDDLVKVGGHRINPQEIEDVLMETGLVVETAVVGIFDELLGNRLAALVVPAGKNSDEQHLLNKCADKLPGYKLPGAIKMVKALPKKASGKIDLIRCSELLKRNKYEQKGIKMNNIRSRKLASG